MSGSIPAKIKTGAGSNMGVLVIFPSPPPSSSLPPGLNNPTVWLVTLARSTTGPVYTGQDQVAEICGACEAARAEATFPASPCAHSQNGSSDPHEPTH